MAYVYVVLGQLGLIAAIFFIDWLGEKTPIMFGFCWHKNEVTEEHRHWHVLTCVKCRRTVSSGHD